MLLGEIGRGRLAFTRALACFLHATTGRAASRPDAMPPWSQVDSSKHLEPIFLERTRQVNGDCMHPSAYSVLPHVSACVSVRHTLTRRRPCASDRASSTESGQDLAFSAMPNTDRTCPRVSPVTPAPAFGRAPSPPFLFLSPQPLCPCFQLANHKV
jgi:hypothetical protein